jgi:hypothetical protein
LRQKIDAYAATGRSPSYYELHRQLNQLKKSELSWLYHYSKTIPQEALQRADRWYPSSKRCSGCGQVKERLLLSERVYRCDACGLVLDRDLNAARNLVQLSQTTLVRREVKPVEKLRWQLCEAGRKCQIDSYWGKFFRTVLPLWDLHHLIIGGRRPFSVSFSAQYWLYFPLYYLNLFQIASQV